VGNGCRRSRWGDEHMGGNVANEVVVMAKKAPSPYTLSYETSIWAILKRKPRLR